MSNSQQSATGSIETGQSAVPRFEGMVELPVAPETVNNKPVAMVGAGRLAAAVWATTDSQGARRHTFNVFRIEAETGRVTQSFSAADVPDLARLVEALTLAMTE